MKKLFRFRARDGYIFLTSYIGDEKVIVIPDTYNGKPVTGISQNCFSKCDYNTLSDIRKIILPDTIEIIEEYAFGRCTGLEEIIFPKSLEIIKLDAFRNCSSLTEIIIPKNVKFIGNFAFQNCRSLKKVICYNDDIDICKNTFPKELPLEDVSFNLIGYLDPKIQIKLIYNLLQKFDTIPFEEQKVIIPFINRKQNLKKELFFTADSEIIALLIREKIKFQINFINELIDYHIKNENTLITAMLLEYKENNFSKKQTEESLERKELVEIGFEAPTFGELRQNWKFSKRDGEIIISGYKGISTDQTIPISIADGTPIKGIENNENSNFKKLEILIIEAEISSIQYYTFGVCENLKEVILPESLTSISRNSFCYCKSLVSIKCHDKLAFIGDKAFIGCKSLKEFYFPKELTYIGMKTFSKCSNLRNVLFHDKLKTIHDYAFEFCEKLVEITIPKNVKKLGAYAFESCYSLEKVEILSKITMLEESTFSNCKNLKEIILPDTLEIIGYLAFSGCSALEEITIPASVKSIYFMAFHDCTKLKKINFLGENVKIDGSAFDGTPLE